MSSSEEEAPRRDFVVPLSNLTQGPLWPPSEVADENGNFVLIGGFILKETSAGRVEALPNLKGVIVSKDTVPPLKNGREDFSNLLGAPYKIVRELDLSKNSKDRDMVLYSHSCGPFGGNFGGGSPRIPGQKDSKYNLNCEPRWNESFAPVGSDSPTYYRPSFPLHQVLIARLPRIPDFMPIGVRVEPGPTTQAAKPDFREKQAITLGDYLRGNEEVKITLLPGPGRSKESTHARFTITLKDLLPNSLFTICAVHSASMLPPNDPRFLLPVPLALPNTMVTDSSGNAEASFEIRNPFPAMEADPHATRIVSIVVTYSSDFQSWGASFTAFGAGVSGHTILGASFSRLTGLTTT